MGEEKQPAPNLILQRIFLVLCLVILLYANFSTFIFNLPNYRAVGKFVSSFYWPDAAEEISLDELILSPEKDADCDSAKYFKLAKGDSCSKELRPEDVEVLVNGTLDKTLDFSRVVLIVSFNKPHFEAIPKVHRLYRGLFLKIVYCVTGLKELSEFRNGTYLPLVNSSIVEFMEKSTDPTGESFYACLHIAYDTLPLIREMVHYEKVDGFLHISDDLVANLWRYRRSELDLTKNWLLGPPQALYDVDQKTFCRGAIENNSQDCTQAEPWHVLHQYQHQIQETLNETAQDYPDFIENLFKASKGYRRVWNIYADLFYVSRSYLPEALRLFRLFAKNRVYMELAVGTVLKGITTPSCLQFIDRTGQISGSYRSMSVMKTYNAAVWFYHPLKLGLIHEASADRQCLYCALAKTFDRLRAYGNNSTPK